MTKYYIHNGQQQEGPFDIEDLRVKNISKDTPIWYDGLSEWSKAGMVPGLKVLFENPQPPPFIIESKKSVPQTNYASSMPLVNTN